MSHELSVHPPPKKTHPLCDKANKALADQRHFEQYAKQLELQLQNAHTRIMQLEIKCTDLQDVCSALSGSTRCQSCGDVIGIPQMYVPFPALPPPVPS